MDQPYIAAKARAFSAARSALLLLLAYERYENVLGARKTNGISFEGTQAPAAFEAVFDNDELKLPANQLRRAQHQPFQGYALEPQKQAEYKNAMDGIFQRNYDTRSTINVTRDSYKRLVQTVADTNTNTLFYKKTQGNDTDWVGWNPIRRAPPEAGDDDMYIQSWAPILFVLKSQLLTSELVGEMAHDDSMNRIVNAVIEIGKTADLREQYQPY